MSRERIDGHWLVEEASECTCAGVDQFGHAAHERGCGLVPLVDLTTLPGWESLTALIADAIEASLHEPGRATSHAVAYGFRCAAKVAREWSPR